MAPKLELGYWDVRGLGEVARLMLQYGGIDYKDTRYKCGQEPPYDRSQWTDVKYKLGLDFPNLPYIIDGDVKLTESWAVYRYIGRKIGIEPTTPNKQAEADMLAGVIEGLRFGFAVACYTPPALDEKKKTETKESELQKLQPLDAYLKGRKFLLGDKISHVDFALFETVDHHRLLLPDILDKLPNLKSFMQRFESLDKIAAHRKSDRFRLFPINNPPALWGGKYE